jgi:DNA-directed RNA polymerase specialized sigma24 family protein
VTTDEGEPLAGRAGFPVTRWSVVNAAAEGDTRASGEAMEKLCRDYWFPLYAFARRSGQSAADAKDLTQGFFALLLEKDWLATADRKKGKLRTFLLTAFRRFMAKEWRRSQAEMRGGQVAILSWEEADAENRYAASRVEIPAEEIFDRQWALTLMERTISGLRNEFNQAGKAEHFELLKATLMSPRGAIDYAEMAVPLAMNEGAVRVAVHRLRKRFRALFREEVARTLAEGQDVDEELRYLARVLA